MFSHSLLLNSCNEDILRLIVSYLESAKDVYALSLTCRSLGQFVKTEGWRTFVRTRFPWFTLQPATPGDWVKLGQSLRFQTRCWERRSFKFRAFLQDPRLFLGAPGRKNGAFFQTVVDAYFDHDAEVELVVWGAGQDLVGRWRERGVFRGSSKVTWHESSGSRSGYFPGPDDIRALVVVRDPMGYSGEYGVLEGRDNGHLRLLSADAAQFGRPLATFQPQSANAHEIAAVEQDTINSLDVGSHSDNLGRVAAATKSTVFLYQLPEDSSCSQIAPLAAKNLREDLFQGRKDAALCSAKWVGGDVIAVALKGVSNPLRYIQVTPTGMTYHTAATNMGLESEHGLKYRNVCPNSLQPLWDNSLAKSGQRLLLSSWKDGTVRLQDLRAPSSFDAIYQDNINPTETLETLLVTDQERFIGASGSDLTIKLFDLRWNRPYHHTSEITCSPHAPFPHVRQPFMQEPPEEAAPTRGRCDQITASLCRWHTLGRLEYYRPNAKIFLVDTRGSQRTPTRRIWSLARPSQISPNFYIGISGGIVEASLEPSFQPPELTNALNPAEIHRDANFAFTDWDAHDQGEPSGYTTRTLVPGIQEIGVGLASPHNQRPIKLPPLVSAKEWALEVTSYMLPEPMRRHRLDRCFQRADDFPPGYSPYVHIYREQDSLPIRSSRSGFGSDPRDYLAGYEQI